jgi:hypothetical protein
MPGIVALSLSILKPAKTAVGQSSKLNPGRQVEATKDDLPNSIFSVRVKQKGKHRQPITVARVEGVPRQGGNEDRPGLGLRGTECNEVLAGRPLSPLQHCQRRCVSPIADNTKTTPIHSR